MVDVLKHICVISDKAIEGNEGEVNTILLSQVISFYIDVSSCMKENGREFDIVAELSKLVEKCYSEHENIDACVSTISETAPPSFSLQVFSQWEHAPVGSSSLVSALHTCLIRGARDGVRSELSGSLLRIQRAREEGRRPMLESAWNADSEDLDKEEEDELGGFIWPSVLDGTVVLSK